MLNWATDHWFELVVIIELALLFLMVRRLLLTAARNHASDMAEIVGTISTGFEAIAGEIQKLDRRMSGNGHELTMHLESIEQQLDQIRATGAVRREPDRNRTG
jgi:hypothetical protein